MKIPYQHIIVWVAYLQLPMAYHTQDNYGMKIKHFKLECKKLYQGKDFTLSKVRFMEG